MNDHALVTALRAGDPQGLAGSYRAYGDQIYTYCYGLLGDLEAAAEVAHDTFVLASQRAGQLRDPDRLRWWLYAIARNECLRRLPRRAWRLPPAPSSPSDPGALGTSEPPATPLPTADGDTAELRPVDDEADDPDWPAEDADADPDAGATVLPAPPGLWPRLELHALDPGLAPEREAVLDRAGRFAASTGFPRPLDVRRRHRLVAVGLVLVAISVTGLLTAVALAPSDQIAAGRSPGSPSVPASPASPAGPPTASPTPSASPSASPTPTSSVNPTAPPTRPPASSPLNPPRGGAADPLAVDADEDVDCVAGGLFGYRVTVTATASAPLDSGELVVTTNSERQSFSMDVDGSTGTAESDLMASAEFEWHVTVTGDDQTAETAPVQVDNPCG